MTHSVRLVIGRGEAVERFLRQWPARAVELKDGWQAIPMEDALYDEIEKAAPGATRPPELDVSPFGLEQALTAATEGGGSLAYVETDYWGGSGGQSAMAYEDGRERMAPQRSRGAGGPINQALRAIGVVRTADDDEFDTIGLGERRTMDDYSPEGPRRLRAPPPEETQPATKVQTLPMWVVLVLVTAFIGLGVAVSVFR